MPYQTNIYLNYASEAWIGDTIVPIYATGMLNILEYSGAIIANINLGGHAFLTDAELAFFDSEDADFGEMPVLVSDPDTIISGIFDDTKDITYFSSQF